MGFFGMISVLAVCGTSLGLAMMYLIAMPQSAMRSALLQAAGWAFAVFCVFYTLSPVDCLPEAFLGPLGIPDDIGAIIGGIASARGAIQAGKDKLRWRAIEEERSAAA